MSPKDLWQRARVALLAVVLPLLAGAAIVVAVHDDDHDGKPDRTTVTITLGGPGAKQVELPPQAQATAQAQAEKADAGDEQVHAGLRAGPPASSAPATVQHNADEQPAGQPAIPDTVPLAAVSAKGCRTTLVRNYSSRNGAPILLGVIHYTASTDHGWDGVLGNVRWFDSPAAQASSNYIIDRRIGACALAVPESQKAWTQAGFNAWSLSVEVTATGREASLVEGKGRTRLLQLIRRWHRVYKLPYRRGAVSGCRVTRIGFVQHRDLGQCGGGHVDVTPFDINPYIAEAKRLDHAAKAKKAPKVTAADRVLCRKINWWRTYRPRGQALRNANLRVKELQSRGLVCQAHNVLMPA